MFHFSNLFQPKNTLSFMEVVYYLLIHKYHYKYVVYQKIWDYYNI